MQRSYPASCYTMYYNKIRVSRKNRENKSDCYMYEYFFFEADRASLDSWLVVEVEYSPWVNGIFVNLGYARDFIYALDINVVITRAYCGLKALIDEIEKSPTIFDLELEKIKRKVSVSSYNLVKIVGPRKESALTLLKEEWARRILDKNNIY